MGSRRPESPSLPRSYNSYRGPDKSRARATQVFLIAHDSPFYAHMNSLHVFGAAEFQLGLTGDRLTPRAEEVVAVISTKGADCTSTCAAKGLVCEALELIDPPSSL